MASPHHADGTTCAPASTTHRPQPQRPPPTTPHAPRPRTRTPPPPATADDPHEHPSQHPFNLKVLRSPLEPKPPGGAETLPGRLRRRRSRRGRHGAFAPWSVGPMTYRTLLDEALRHRRRRGGAAGDVPGVDVTAGRAVRPAVRDGSGLTGAEGRRPFAARS